MFARDFYNLHRGINSMFNTLNSRYNMNMFEPSSMMMELDDEDEDLFFSPRLGLLGASVAAGGNNYTSETNKDESATQAQQQKSLSSRQPQQGQEQRLATTTGSNKGANEDMFLSSFFPGAGISTQFHIPIPKLSMSMDVNSTAENYIVTCDLPGVDKSSIDIEADKRHHRLTIKAEKRSEYSQTSPSPTSSSEKSGPTSGTASSPSAAAAAGGGGGDKSVVETTSGSENKNVPRIIRQERAYGSVQRSIRLSTDADVDNITAKYENGVLTLTIPRMPQQERKKQQAHKIQVA